MIKHLASMIGAVTTAALTAVPWALGLHPHTVPGTGTAAEWRVQATELAAPLATEPTHPGTDPLRTQLAELGIPADPEPAGPETADPEPEDDDDSDLIPTGPGPTANSPGEHDEPAQAADPTQAADPAEDVDTDGTNPESADEVSSVPFVPAPDDDATQDRPTDHDSDAGSGDSQSGDSQSGDSPSGDTESGDGAEDEQLDADGVEPQDGSERSSSWRDLAVELARELENTREDPAAQELLELLTELDINPGDARQPDGTREPDDAQEPGNGDPGSDAGSGGPRETDSAGELVWEADVETGDLSQFEGGGDDSQQVGSPEPEIVDDPEVVRDGEHAVAFTIPGGGNRNEVLPDAGFEEGDELYFGFSTLLDDGFPVDASWQVITQWKNDGTGSPPLSLNVENGEYLLHGGHGHPDGGREFHEPIGPATTGEWVDWVIFVRFSSDDDAQVDVWQNGKQIVEGLSPAGGTLYPGLGSYLKIGYYRDTAIDESGTVVFDNWRMGTSYDAVDPSAATAGSETSTDSAPGREERDTGEPGTGADDDPADVTDPPIPRDTTSEPDGQDGSGHEGRPASSSMTIERGGSR